MKHHWYAKCPTEKNQQQTVDIYLNKNEIVIFRWHKFKKISKSPGIYGSDFVRKWEVS